MKVTSVRDLGALVRSTRRSQGLTQAELADRLGVARDWVVRLEQGHPRLEAQKVLDALAALDLTLTATARKGATTPNAAVRPTGRSVEEGKQVRAARNYASKTSKGRTVSAKSGRFVSVNRGHTVSVTPNTNAPSKTLTKNGTWTVSKAGTKDPFEELFGRR